MPFVRFSRDKRGYEHTYLVHESGGRGRPGRARVLYWFRTPAGIKVGREPFDAEARRAIEAQHPGLSFDWAAIASTPMPPVPEVEHWRERRRLERAAKVARREEEEQQSPEQTEIEPELDVGSLTVAEPVVLATGEPTDGAPLLGGPVAADDADVAARKRRRRRGGRRRRVGTQASGEPATETEDGDAALENLDLEVGENVEPEVTARSEAAATPAESPEHQSHAAPPTTERIETSEDDGG